MALPLALFGVVALVVVSTVAGPELACRSLRPAPGGFAPAICIMDWTGRAQAALRVELADQVDDVFRIGAVMCLLSVLPPLAAAPAGWRRGVSVAVGLVMVVLAVRLWILGVVPGLAMTASGTAAAVVAVRAVLRPRATVPAP